MTRFRPDTVIICLYAVSLT